MKSKSNSFYVATIVITCLLVVTAYLFIENKHYQTKNRELFLQNDSITSANIELKDTIKRLSKPAYAGKPEIIQPVKKRAIAKKLNKRYKD
jgi:hypothetical protein